MNDADVTQLRAQIEARLAELETEDALGQEGQATVELDQQAVGRLSRMDALQNQAMAHANAGRRQAERHKLETALSRMNDGEFGYCEECGELIARRRLELDPAALLCIECARG